MTLLRAACIQVNAGDNPEKNLEKIRRLFLTAVRAKCRLVAFPENFFWRGRMAETASIARKFNTKVLQEYQALARANKTAVLLGSILEPAFRGKFYNTSILINEKGEIAARYRKIHLFDVRLKDVRVCESKQVQPGTKPVTGKMLGLCAGLSICYDVRFPELYRVLAAKGSRILFVPANFTEKTGRAHWEVLLRARAVENQAFVVAPAQSGAHPATGIRSFGNSLIIDPWGRVLARGAKLGDGVIFAGLDMAQQAVLRRRFPVLKHRILRKLP